MKTHIKILVVIALYCAIFTWMFMPFVTADRTMFRKQVMFIDTLQEQIVADNAAVISN